MKKYWLLTMLLTLLFFGCAPKQKPRVLFPPPPDTPRLEFIGIYSSENSFEKTPFQEFTESILGASAHAQFKSPFGIVSDGRGVVYVSDLHWHNLRVYDFNNKTVEFYLAKPIFAGPAGLALDSNGRLYVADAGDGKIYVFGPDRQILNVFGTPEDITAPSFLAINEQLGRVYVTDGQSHRVVVYDMSGQHLFSFGERGVGDGEFHAPQGIAFSPDGSLYVVDQFNARIQVFDAEGKFLRKFGERGDQVSQFVTPKDVAFDSEGHLYVVDARRGDVMTLTPEGRMLLATGSRKLTTAPLGFGSPRSIFIDQNDRIYVSDLTNRRFSVWQYMSAAYLEQHPVTEEDQALIDRYLRLDK